MTIGQGSTQVIKTESEDVANEAGKLSYTGKAPPLTSQELESMLKKSFVARIRAR